METRVSLNTLNPYISCYICNGYLIDATAITECLHTFCKSCIVRRLDSKKGNTCPKCDVVIHRSNPLHGIRLDRKMQDIVFKLVPGLQLRESVQEKAFCKLQGIPYEKNHPLSFKGKQDPTPEDRSKAVEATAEDRVCIQLETKNIDALKPLNKKFICCSSRTTVNHVKKLVAKKLFCDLEKYCSVDILCNDEILGKDHTLKFIYVTRWRFKDPPLMLYYQPRVDVLSFDAEMSE